MHGDPRRAPGFERFVTESATRLLRTSYLLSGERGAAEDLLQLALLRTARRWRVAQQAPEAYARQVLVNLVRDRHRRASRRVEERPAEEAIGRGLHTVVTDHAEMVVGRDEVLAALAQLTTDQREVLVLRFYADLSVTETAAATGTSEGTVKSRTSRALARMRGLLAASPTSSPQPTSHEVADDDRRAAERIRVSLNAEVADLLPPVDLLRQLQSAPTFGFDRRRRWPSQFAGAVALLTSVAAVALVVALALPGHRRASSSGLSTVPAGTPAGARALIARMAVFRRPQTPADRLPAPVRGQLINSGFGSALVPSLTRLVAAFNGGARRVGGESIYALVGRPRGYPADIVTAVVVTGGTGHRYLVTPPEVVEEQAGLQTGGLTPSAVSSDHSYVLCGPTWCKTEPLPGRQGVTVAVVPDGVTRVKWVFTPAPPAGGSPVTVYPRVEDNVAISTAVSGAAGLLAATWYGANGEVIKPTVAPLPPMPRRPVPAVVGRSFAALRGVPANHAVAIADNIGLRVWLVPHPTMVCLQWTVANPVRARGGGAGDCVPISMALAGKFSPASFAPNGETVIGLAPNGNRTVRLTLVNGAIVTVPVVRNVYFARATQVIRTVTLKDSRGKLQTWRVPDGE